MLNSSSRSRQITRIWKIGAENNNNNQKLIKEKWVPGMMEAVVKELETVLVEKIKNAREKDKEVIKIVEEIQKIGVRNLRGNK